MGVAAEGFAGGLARASLALARRFRAGATMWCVAPGRPAHARHIAVEFVHPVIVGKRALDAVAVTVDDVDDADPAAALRLLARPGDVAVVVSQADDDAARDVLHSSPAWGVTTVWLVLTDGADAADADDAGVADGGAEPGVADHVLPVAEADLIVAYHVLWELTHVCFEHPGLLVEAGAS